MTLLRRLWHDRSGVIASMDLILLSAILGIGILVGVVALRDQVVQELGDISGAIGHLDQSYSYPGDGNAKCDECYVAGSSYVDRTDFGQTDDVADQEPAGIQINGTAPHYEGEDLSGGK